MDSIRSVVVVVFFVENVLPFGGGESYRARHWHIPVGCSGGGWGNFAGNRNELLARSFCISIFVSVSVFVSVLHRNESKFCAFFLVSFENHRKVCRLWSAGICGVGRRMTDEKIYLNWSQWHESLHLNDCTTSSENGSWKCGMPTATAETFLLYSQLYLA